MNVTLEVNSDVYPITFYANVNVQKNRIIHVNNAWMVINNPPLPFYYEVDFNHTTSRIIDGHAEVTYDYYIRKYLGTSISIISIGIPLGDKVRSTSKINFYLKHSKVRTW